MKVVEEKGLWQEAGGKVLLENSHAIKNTLTYSKEKVKIALFIQSPRNSV